MSRVKRGVAASKRRNYLLKRAKGFNAKGKSTFRLAKQRLLRADDNSYRSRKLRKRDFRQLWIQRINGALDFIGSDLNYSRFIGFLNRSDLKINRKMISEIAISDIEGFKVIVATVQGAKHTPITESKVEKKTKAKPTTETPVKASAEVIESKDEVIEVIEEETTVKEVEVVEAPAPKKAKVTTKSSDADDLKVVEGIGPAIEKLLHSKGILTYEDLANSDVDNLKAILAEAGSNYSIHNPSTWAKQSRLAADGMFDELKTLKDELHKGQDVA
jgi:large subunit ribosomal protein L20